MRREIIGILSVLVLSLVLIAGCGGDGAGLQVSALSDTGVRYPGTVSTATPSPWDNTAWTNPGKLNGR
jgi:multidrug efflux pump subunit AcrA (membrane-fusion protein)